jgi:tetratricopeptide (TPR) repeat protein
MQSTTDLQQRAVEFAKAGDFGPRALETNLELTKAAPANEGAWTRLARCYIEASLLDEATAALDAALQMNPQNTIARNLQADVTRRRVVATTPIVPPRARAARTTRRDTALPAAGFGRAEFAALGQLQPSTAVESLGPRVESLLMALNERPFAAKAVETRNRAGRSGARLFRRNSFYPGGQGHLFAFHHGGRWEPQLNVGFFAAPQWGRDCVRAGVGFNLTLDGSDPDREDGLERAMAYFAHFQRMVSSEWRILLTDWMSHSAGFIQYGDRPPSTGLLPHDAIASLVNLQSAAEVGWVFCGRWLFADQPSDAEILQDSRALTAWIDESFSALLPLWSSLFRAA